MPSTKAELRKDALIRRDGIDAEARAAFAARLVALGPRLLLDFAPANPRLVVSLYAAIRNEPDMMPLALALQAAGVPVALPVAFSHGTALVFRRWETGDPLAPGPLGIAEPLPSAPVVEPDVLFVPLAAFDRRGHRIGYGAGHYDRTLANLRGRKRVRAIGVAFAAQEVLYVPSEAHDEALDLIVTERDVLVCEA